MADNQSSEPKIPVLKDVVIAATSGDTSNATAQPSLLSSTLQAEIDAIINQARADFEATIAQLQVEMQQRVEQELSELHIQLTADD